MRSLASAMDLAKAPGSTSVPEDATEATLRLVIQFQAEMLREIVKCVTTIVFSLYSSQSYEQPDVH